MPLQVLPCCGYAVCVQRKHCRGVPTVTCHYSLVIAVSAVSSAPRAAGRSTAQTTSA